MRKSFLLYSPAELRLRRIIHETHDKLLSALLPICSDRHQCDDILQETYIRLWKNLDNIQHDESVIVLLRKYARNIFLDELRKAGRREIQEITTDLPLAEVSVEAQAIAREQYRDIQKAIDKLPPQQQLIFRLHKEEALSYKQIAERLDIANGTIEKQMGRALKFLRRELGPLHRSPDIYFFICLYQVWKNV